MREVEVERFVQATEAELERVVTPELLVQYEGSFVVQDVDDRDDGWLVTVGARGLEMELWFEALPDGLRYEQRESAGPFEEMWTTVTYTAKDDGSNVVARSGVSLDLPVAAISDRIAAWKRRGELERALDRLADDVS